VVTSCTPSLDVNALGVPSAISRGAFRKLRYQPLFRFSQAGDVLDAVYEGFLHLVLISVTIAETDTKRCILWQ
jgi:predicted transcriptional regulator